MRPLFARALGLVIVTAMVIVGCKSMYGTTARTSSGTGAPTTPTGTTAAGSANGFFPPGSNDVPGAAPVIEAEVVAEEGEETASNFRAIQLDPVQEDTAGPKFVVAADIDEDGFLDLASAWNQSQPVQIHLQRRDAEGAIRFQSVTIGGTAPVAVISGLEIVDLDGDSRLDLAVLVKDTGYACTSNGEIIPDPSCLFGDITLYFQPTDVALVNDAEAWEQVTVDSSELLGIIEPQRQFDEIKTEPEWAGFTAMDAGDVDGDGDPDLVVGYNPFVEEEEGGSTSFGVDLYLNPGGAAARTGAGWPAPLMIDRDPAFVKDVEFLDVDEDGDLDILATYPNIRTQNVRWIRNPGGAGAATAFWEGFPRPIGEIDKAPGDNVYGPDVLTTGDMDGDGHVDVLVRSTDRRVVQWFRHPDRDSLIEPLDSTTAPTQEPRVNFPWQVYTLVEDEKRDPMAIGVGDLTADGQVEAAVAIGGALQWFDSATARSGIFSEWGFNFVLDDTKEQGTTADPTDPDFVDAATFINDVIVADLDGDGFGDIIATIDRRVVSGVADDTLIWFRNTLGDEAAPD